MKMKSNVRLVKEGSVFKLVDNEAFELTSRKVMRLLERYKSYFIDLDNLTLSPDLNYIELTELIDKLNAKLDNDIEIDSEIQAFIAQNRYAINEQKSCGFNN